MIAKQPEKRPSSESDGSRPFLSMDDVTLRTPAGPVFQRTSWKILEHQRWAIVGPNGSGKSTLARGLCGSVPVIHGQIVYHFLTENGSDASGSVRRRPQDAVAYVSLETQHQTAAYANTFYQARWNSLASEDMLSVSDYLSERHVKNVNPYQVMEHQTDPTLFAVRRDQTIALLDIAALLDKNLAQLSNGERRKVQIARALLKDPHLLILDNPLSGLDTSFRNRFHDIVHQLTHDRIHLLWVTSRPEEIPDNTTHVFLVENYAVVRQGPRDAVLAGYQTKHPRRVSAPSQVAEHASKRSERAVLVRMRDVDVSYGHTQVLNQVSWTVREGERWALIGPNGSGKTTLLSLILGDNPQAYNNDISLFGKQRGSGESIWSIKQRIGWVSPELHLYYPKHFSCVQVVCSGFFDSIGLYAACSPEQQATAHAWMKRLGISRHAYAALSDVSHGEQRLMLMARALVKQPQLLVLDEPCQGLDAKNRDQLLKTIDLLGRQTDVTMIYVTHDTDQVPGIITHLLALENGSVKTGARILGDTSSMVRELDN